MKGRRREAGTGRLWIGGLLAMVAALGVAVEEGRGQALPAAAPASLRLASVSQWVIGQHRQGGGAPLAPSLAAALDGGVVERTVYWWQRGVIQRRALAAKPVRLLTGPEAEALGARGEGRLVAVRPPGGERAWTEVELAIPPSGEGALVLEVGGEINTERQVLESLFEIGADGRISELPLSPRALYSAPGVPVLRRPFGRPLEKAEPFFRGPGGAEALVVRSTVATIVNGQVTASGLADSSPDPGNGSGDWREGDRVLVRLTLAALRAGVPGLLLGWKDRALRPDPDAEFPRRAALGPFLVR